MLPAPVLRVLTGYEMSCSATGTPSIYTAIIRNSTTMVNVTGTATIVIKEEGNYTCVATNKYGTDVGEVSVIFTDCRLICVYEEFQGWMKNTLSCRNVTSPGDIVKCPSTITKNMNATYGPSQGTNPDCLTQSESRRVTIRHHASTNPYHCRVFSGNLSHLPAGMFSKLTNLRILDLSSNKIQSLPDGVFADLINLYWLNLSSNQITSLPDGVFAKLTNLDRL
ncbi:hypothetical protein ACROYT_G026118 [Oculina patagonica]